MEKEKAKLLYNEISPNHDNKPYQNGDWRKVPEIEHSENCVKGFFGEYRFLSNFSKAHIVFDGLIYSSVEKAYQAAKWHPDYRSYFVECSNEESIVYNREHKPNAYSAEIWDSIKLEIMDYLLAQKFDPAFNIENCNKLLETGDRYLEETNWWNDTFWGKTLQGEGENHLGQTLMSIRETLNTRDNLN